MTLQAFLIGVLEFLSFLIVTVNFRACAKGKIALTVGTDVLIATIGFEITQRIAEATTLEERLAYIVGASLGSVSGMRLTRRWDEPS